MDGRSFRQARRLKFDPRGDREPHQVLKHGSEVGVFFERDCPGSFSQERAEQEG